jgi:DNA polymerase-4
MRHTDFSRATRSHTLTLPTMHTETILTTARALFATAGPLIDAKGLTLIGLALSNLDNDDAVQLMLPFEERETGALDATLDVVRDRFGTAAVTRAVLLGRDEGPTVPLLPD